MTKRIVASEDENVACSVLHVIDEFQTTVLDKCKKRRKRSSSSSSSESLESSGSSGSNSSGK